MKGKVFNIQPYSIHDGPGIRTVVFLKGCPLRCIWCCNPESQSMKNSVYYIEKFCQKCGRCVNACENGEVTIENGKIMVDRSKCDEKMQFVNACHNEALKKIGEEKTADEVIEQVKRDSQMYEVTGGGMTLSGGECLMQPEFAFELIEKAKENGIGTYIETCGFCDQSDLMKALSMVDGIYYDIKIVDSQEHKKYIGVDNERIIQNACMIADNEKVVFRLPVIPNITAKEKNIYDVAMLLKEMKRDKIVIIPFHELGVDKYKYLNLSYTYEAGEYEIDKIMKEVKDKLKSYGIEAISS